MVARVPSSRNDGTSGAPIFADDSRVQTSNRSFELILLIPRNLYVISTELVKYSTDLVILRDL